MRRAKSLLAVLLSSCGETQSNLSPAPQMIAAANAEKDRAMVKGDAPALEQFYTADYQVIDDDGNVHNKRNQVQFMTEAVDLLDAKSADVQVRMLSQNAALVTGRMTGRYRQNGRTVPFAERYTSVWIIEHNQWRVRHEHASTIEGPR